MFLSPSHIFTALRANHRRRQRIIKAHSFVCPYFNISVFNKLSVLNFHSLFHPSPLPSQTFRAPAPSKDTASVSAHGMAAKKASPKRCPTAVIDQIIVLNIPCLLQYAYMRPCPFFLNRTDIPCSGYSFTRSTASDVT